MNFCVFTSNRNSTLLMLKYILDSNNHISLCVFEETEDTELKQFCIHNSIKYVCYNDIEKMIATNNMPNIDFAFSFLYHKILKSNVIDFFDSKIINFHPSLVQIHKGVASFCYCVLNEYETWGVTAQYLVEGVDEGDIILQREFKVPRNCYGIELEKIQQDNLILLFKDVFNKIINNIEIEPIRQDLKSGVYYGHKDLNRDKMISLSDSHETIDKKIRAFWYPPYHGASIIIDGKQYTLVNDELLKLLSDNRF